MRSILLAAVLLPACLLAQPAAVKFFEPLEISIPGGFGLINADLNGDGYSDLATCIGSVTGGGIEIILSNGKGGFHPPTLIPVDNEPGPVVAGDFNGDGIIDLITSTTQGLVFLPGLGRGAFGSPVTVSSMSGGIAAADFNNDGKLDLAITINSGVQILLGNGDGTFSPAGSVTVPFSPEYFFTADFNVDGNPDVLVVGHNLHGILVGGVLLGDGHGNLTPKSPLYIQGYLPGLAISDVNGDGIPDLLFPSNGIAVSFGNGDGTFSPGPTRSMPMGDGALAVADVNGDGKPDVVALTSRDSAFLMYGNGDGTFTTPVGYVGGPGSLFPTIVPLYQPSGVQGFATLGSSSPLSYYDSTVTILPVSHTKLFAPLMSAPAQPFGIVTGDFNNDGKLDLATSVPTGLAVLLGNGDGTFKPPAVQAGFGGYPPIAVADMNHDGIPDVVVNIVPSPFGLAIFLGNGDGTFHPLGTTPVLSYSSGWVGIADVNGDGVPDVVNVSYDMRTPALVFLNNGDGTFGTPISLPYDAHGPLVLADFNGDGKIDMAVTFGGRSAVMLGNGDGTFQAPIQVQGIQFPGAAADLDGDGRLDLVGYTTSTTNTTYLSVALGNGDGTFGAPKNYPLQPEFGTNATVTIADWNGDGHLDIAAMSEYSYTYFFLGDGQGNFTPQPNGLLLYNAPFPAVGDFDGDGLPDVASASGGVWILRNTSLK